jgi:hypothetical protein
MAIPDVNSLRFIDFIKTLRDTEVRPAKGLPYLQQDDQLQNIFVPVAPLPEYQSLYCWFNCLDYQQKNNGNVVFGWAIWHTDRNTLLAQHHAVWQSNKGQYLDITPNELAVEKILFVPDNRAPFDYHGLRAPLSFEQDKKGTSIWVTAEGATFGFFSVQKLILSKNDLQNLSNLDCLKQFNYGKKDLSPSQSSLEFDPNKVVQ